MFTNYHPSADQVALAASLAKSLKSILPLSRLRESREEGAPTWSALRELGVFDACVPEDRGGSGLGATEEALIALELGRCAASPSVLSTLAAMHASTGVGGLPAQADFHVAAGYRRGNRVVFIADDSANLLLVRDAKRSGLYAYPERSRLLDGYLWSNPLRQVEGTCELLADVTPAAELRMRLLDGAVLAGLAQAALAMAVEYAGLREQFGRPIGSYQAIKHACANMALAARCASDQVTFAAVAMDEERDDAELQVESAFYVASSSALANAGKNIQIHGGVGFSDEAIPHRLLKRARVLLEIGGGREAALMRLADCPAQSALSSSHRE